MVSAVAENSAVQALTEVLQQKNKEINHLQKTVKKLAMQQTKQHKKMQTAALKQKALQTKLRLQQHECSQIHKSNLYRRYSRLQKKLDEKNKQLQILRGVEEELKTEKGLKRRYQICSCKNDAKRRKLGKELEKARDAIKALQDVAAPIPVTRDVTGRFTEGVVKCVMELETECEVPARRCSDVIRSVSQHLFGVEFYEHSLPSKTTNLRIADQTHSLAKFHIAEEMANKEYDLHTDGTSKNTKKYVGFQVTLEDKKMLSLGFDPVARENVQTVLDLTVNKLSELALLYSPDDSAHQLKNMLRNMVGIMTDRANTMKAFDRQLDSLRTEVANPEIQLEFLYCNAHFLLGLTTAAEKALTEVAKERGLEGKRTGRKEDWK